jgi:hypothetical protein
VSRIATVSVDLDELRLVAAAKDGDTHAYGQLVRRHQVAVFHAAYLLTASELQAQTVTMQAFVQAWASLRRLPVTVPFGDWMLSLLPSGAAVSTPPDGDRPAAPDLSQEVLTKLHDRSRRGRGPGLGALAAVVAMVAITVVIVVPALRSTPERRARSSASVAQLTPLAGAERFPLGQRIPVSEARHAAAFEALLPPNPGGAYLGRDVPGGRVSIIAGRMLITEFHGTSLPDILTLIGPGTHAKLTWVNGHPGVYGSSVHPSAPGDVLTWLQGSLTVRIEAANTLEQALALARRLS